MRTLSIRKYKPEWSPAYLSNGVVGLRVTPFPGIGSRSVLNGFVGVDAIEGVQGTPFIPYPLFLDVRLGPWWLSDRPNLGTFVGQDYDLSCGELTTTYTMTVDGTTATVEVLTFCSRSLPTMVCQEVRATLDRPGRLLLRAGVAANGAEGTMTERLVTESMKDFSDGAFSWASPGGLSQLGMAYSTESPRADGKGLDHWGVRTLPVTTLSYDLQAGETALLRQITSVVPGMMHHEPHRQAVRMVYMGGHKGFDALKEENRRLWADLWKGRPVVLGADDRWQAMADAAYFYLHTSVHQASPASTGLFGLGQWTNYHYFRGHVFWDIETYSVPNLIITAPHAAKACLDYRSARLDAARRNAAMNGYRGLQFPWESGTLGEEVTPSLWPFIIHEQHINADVAIAFAQYAHATGDAMFLREQAWPVLKGVAEWIASRGHWTPKGYEIHCVTGIDEGAHGVDNSGYLNMGAVIALREAAHCARAMGYTPPVAWERMADAMYLPKDPETGAILKYDGFTCPEGTGACPDPLMALFPLGYPADEGTTAATYRYYLARTGGDQLSYPMVSSPFAAWACRAGDRRLAAELLERGVADFLFEPFMQVDEFGKGMTHNKEKVGPYLANLGGFLQSLYFGFTGVQMGPGPVEGWGRYPVAMPEGWGGIEVERILARDGEYSLRALQGMDRAELRPL